MEDRNVIADEEKVTTRTFSIFVVYKQKFRPRILMKFRDLDTKLRVLSFDLKYYTQDLAKIFLLNFKKFFKNSTTHK